MLCVKIEEGEMAGGGVKGRKRVEASSDAQAASASLLRAKDGSAFARWFSLSLSLDICFLYMVLYVTLLPLDGLLYLIDEYVIWVYAVKSAERMCRWHSSACTAAPSMLRSN